MSNEWRFIAEAAIHYIETKASERDNPLRDLRCDYADLMGENKYRNRQFEELVSMIDENLEAIKEYYDTNGRDRMDTIVERGVFDLVNGHYCSVVLANDELANKLPRDIYNEMSRAKENFNRLLGRRRGLRGGGLSTGGRYTERRREDRGSNYRSNRESTGRGSKAWWDDDDNTGSTTGGDGWSYLASDNSDSGNASKPTQQYEEPNEEPVVEVKKPEPEHRVEGPDFTKERPYDRFFINGEEWRAYHLSGWTLTPDPKHREPIITPTLYDLNHHLKFYVRDAEGIIKEKLIMINDDNRYLQHELRHTNVDVGSPRGKAAIRLSALRDGGPKEPDDGEDESKPKRSIHLVDHLKQLDPTDYAPENIEVFGSLSDAVFKTRSRIDPESVNGVRLGYCVKRTPVMCSNWKQHELIEKIHASFNLSHAAVQMRELKHEFDARIWDELNRRFSQLLLRMCTYQFQIPGLRKLSFADDWEKVVAYIETKRGSEAAVSMAQRGAYLISQACSFAAREDHESMMDIPNGSDVPAVIFLDFHAIVTISANCDEVGLGKQLDIAERGVAVTAYETHNIELGGVLTDIYENSLRLMNGMGVTAQIHLEIATSDNRVIEVFPYLTTSDRNYILAPVDL